MTAGGARVGRWAARALALALSALLAVALGGGEARAHSLRVAHVQLVEGEAGVIELSLKSPALGGGVADLRVATPPGCERGEGAVPRLVEGGLLERWSLRCPQGLAGLVVAVEGLGGGVNDAIVSWEDAAGAVATTMAWVGAPRVVLPGGAGPVEASRGTWPYLGLGVEHILAGPDHLLFVLGLLVVVWRRGRGMGAPFVPALLGTVTAFTVAHSVTLGLSTLGHVGLPSGPVELTIAVSILLLGVELVRNGEGAQTWTFRYPWLVAFAFGLLHGFGFAGALAEIGLPEGAVASALVLFNVGVELGQLAFVAAVLVVMAAARAVGAASGRAAARSRVAAGYAIGVTAAYWVIERAVGVWGA